MNSTVKPYAAVWRWHFYVGLFVAPVLLILAMTGALYLFEHEIERVWYADLIQIKPQVKPANKSLAQAMSIQQQANLITQQYPSSQIVSVAFPRALDESFTWKINDDSVNDDVFIDAYQAKILGSVESDWRLMGVISRLHGKLLIGKIGGFAVAAG